MSGLSHLSVEPERHRGRYGGTAAFASVALSIGALVVANSAGNKRPRTVGAPQVTDNKLARLHQIQDFHANPEAQTVAVILRCLALFAAIALAVHLYWLIQRREGDVGRIVIWSAVAGTLLVSASTIYGYFALNDVADAFFASGVRNADRASQLVDDSAGLHVATVGDIVSRIAFAPWIVIISTQMMRLGLIGSFLGYFGIAGGLALIILPIGDAMYIGWLASMGFLLWGYWPGGRPAPWDNPALTGTPAGV